MSTSIVNLFSFTRKDKPTLFRTSRIYDTIEAAMEGSMIAPDAGWSYRAMIPSGTISTQENFILLNENEYRNRIDVLKSDERNYYERATVFVNAPLALIQLQLSTEINTLEQILGLPLSKFPLKKK